MRFSDSDPQRWLIYCAAAESSARWRGLDRQRLPFSLPAGVVRADGATRFMLSLQLRRYALKVLPTPMTDRPGPIATNCFRPCP